MSVNGASVRMTLYYLKITLQQIAINNIQPAQNTVTAAACGQARSQDCQNEEAYRSSALPLPSPPLPYPPSFLPSLFSPPLPLRSRPIKYR